MLFSHYYQLLIQLASLPSFSRVLALYRGRDSVDCVDSLYFCFHSDQLHPRVCWEMLFVLRVFMYSSPPPFSFHSLLHFTEVVLGSILRLFILSSFLLRVYAFVLDDFICTSLIHAFLSPPLSFHTLLHSKGAGLS